MEERPLCYYCGDWQECRDHQIPGSYHAVTRKLFPKETVPCCTMCNSMKSDKMFESSAKIATYLIGRYQDKYKKILRLPHWTRHEINKLDYALGKMVKANQVLKCVIRAKIENLILVEYGRAPIPLDYHLRRDNTYMATI